MRISYNELWKMLIDKEMNKQYQKELSDVSATPITKLVKDENITTIYNFYLNKFLFCIYKLKLCTYYFCDTIRY